MTACFVRPAPNSVPPSQSLFWGRGQRASGIQSVATAGIFTGCTTSSSPVSGHTQKLAPSPQHPTGLLSVSMALPMWDISHKWGRTKWPSMSGGLHLAYCLGFIDVAARLLDQPLPLYTLLEMTQQGTLLLE